MKKTNHDYQAQAAVVQSVSAISGKMKQLFFYLYVNTSMIFLLCLVRSQRVIITLRLYI